MEDIHFGKICFLPSGCEPFSALSPHECQFRWPSDNLELGTVTDIFVVMMVKYHTQPKITGGWIYFLEIMK